MFVLKNIQQLASTGIPNLPKPNVSLVSSGSASEQARLRSEVGRGCGSIASIVAQLGLPDGSLVSKKCANPVKHLVSGGP